MKKILKPAIKYAIDKAKRSKFVQNIFEAPFDLEKFEKMGVFIDTNGKSIELLDGLRTKIRPGWEQMLTSKKTEITKKYLNKNRQNGFIAVNKIIPIVESFGKRIENSSILEVGCHSGAASFALADSGASSVVGTEFSGYKIESVIEAEEQFENNLLEVNEYLKKIRHNLSMLFQESNKVQFIDDDICNSNLTSSSFDIICSWEVLEHVHDPKNAFASMYDLLADDGIMIHEYNPFFCLNGGHSLCTLDMLWGHTRINDSDFCRYLDEVRPNEKERAISFYQKGLNRMTIHDLNQFLQNAGFKAISVIPFTKEQHMRMINEDILKQTQLIYPNATILDLAAPRVFIIVKK